MGYTNSGLVDCVVKSPNHSGQRTHSIDRITPHCVVGQLSAEGIGSCFPAGRQASCNYGIGNDGRMCLIVDEKNRSWCTSSNANDQRAVTIECASDMSEPYAMTNAVYEKLIKLCTDICKRYGKTKLVWIADKNTALSYNPKPNEMQLTVHRWFANKSCPGNWLFSRLGEVARRVNVNLGSNSKPTTPSTGSNLYRVRKTSGDAKSQVGAYKNLANAKKKADETGLKVFDQNGNQVYPAVTNATSYLVRIDATDLNIRKGPGTNYSKVGVIKPTIYTIVAEADGEGATKWCKLKSGAGWISKDYVKVLN